MSRLGISSPDEFLYLSAETKQHTSICARDLSHMTVIKYLFITNLLTKNFKDDYSYIPPPLPLTGPGGKLWQPGSAPSPTLIIEYEATFLYFYD